jgi:putative ABC transport system substrate-binding protein
MKKFPIIIILLLAANLAWAASNTEIKKVCISQVIDHPALNKTTQGIIEGLEDAGFKRGVNLEVRVESAQANPAMAAQIASKFVSQNPDVVVGVGTISAQSFLKFTAQKRVQLVFSSVTDPVAAHLATTDNKALTNISGVSNFVRLEPQLQMIKDLQPNLKRLGVIYNLGEINSVSIVQKLESACAAYNIVLQKQAVTKTADVAQAVVKLATNVDAIFISNDNTALSSLRSIVQTANQRSIPVYVSDTDAVELGALAALGPNQLEVGRQTGRMIAKILQGTDINTVPIEYPIKSELFINLQAAAIAKLPIASDKLSQANNILKQSKS